MGFALGYFYGTKAGQQRYQQIDRYLTQMRQSDAYQDLRSRVVELVDDNMIRARGAAQDAAFGAGTPRTDSMPSPFDYSGDPTLN